MTFPSPPRGIKAIPWRIPIYLYRTGFGWALGNRFLLLRHIGRISGEDRYAVLELIHSTPEEGVYYVVSGFGTRSDWFQNILKQPQVKIQVGAKKMSAVARRLDPSDGAGILLAYAQEHPGSLKTLSSLLGYQIDFTREGILDFGRQIPVVQFTTQSTTPTEKNQTQKELSKES